eukprot:TRINITY_DN1092_c0_g1_i1.p1 TRINITY_DN1092_c0_g1~~TRINITY_DN1092_c0_g1_i1.p1  ORF type:complete len:319 (+),score=95.83 TRINITY_DN1092_c0_g1_i1:126-1082(+)
MSQEVPTLVTVHPLVLLSSVDHYTRVASDTSKRVVGILLGTNDNGKIEVTNSYAVPFEEDRRKKDIWFFDFMYHEAMWAMYRKVNASEKVIGWYSSGPKIVSNDLEINEIIRKYCEQPVFVVIDVRPKEVGIPTKAYVSLNEVDEDHIAVKRFQHVPCVIGALEAEEVGVEHLLRDIKDTNISTLSTRINNQILSLKGLITRLSEMHEYVDNVVSKKLPVNHVIIRQIQEIFNLIPNLNSPSLLKAFMVKTNDNMLAIYVASLVRSVTTLHDLINNKLEMASYESGEKKLEGKSVKKGKEEGDAEKDSEKDSAKEEKE